ncbi:MAG: hypothetical protein K6A81_05080 [Clostridiales bacterium]|nr:hypothetical protein [Clostridiales bacterium]
MLPFPYYPFVSRAHSSREKTNKSPISPNKIIISVLSFEIEHSIPEIAHPKCSPTCKNTHVIANRIKEEKQKAPSGDLSKEKFQEVVFSHEQEKRKGTSPSDELPPSKERFSKQGKRRETKSSER